MSGEALEKLIVEVAEQARDRYYGKYRGIVTDVDDPEGLGRLRALVPEIMGEVETPWALPCAPYAGARLGFYSVPPVDAGIWMEFEAGDPARPIWSGTWWASDELPRDEHDNETTPSLKVFRTEQGYLLAMDDARQTIALSDADGRNLLRIDIGSNELRVEAGAKVVVEAPQIELVDGASHPLIFGDDLLQYLNQLVTLYQTHTHPGQTAMGVPVTPAPPVPPFQVPSPSMLSLKTKTG